MSRETAHVSLEKDSLKIKVQENSPLLGDIHRVFLVNVLGFDPSDNFSGYVIAGDASYLKLLTGVVEYLEEQGIRTKLNASAQNASQRFKNATDDLVAARRAGRAIKSKLPRVVDVPKLRRSLKPYQIPAVAHAIAVKNAANFSVPGSGKTAIVLSAFAILRSRNEVNKIVVIGPRSSFMPWEEEYYACFLRKARSIRITGNRPGRLKLYRDADEKELVLLTYQMASRDQDNIISFLRQNKTLLVLDESHNIKRLEGGTWASALINIGSYANRRNDSHWYTGAPLGHRLVVSNDLPLAKSACPWF